MDSTEAIYDGLKDAGIDFIVSVPCVNLSKLLNMIDDDVHYQMREGLV